jgi:hypothetical protein
MRWWWAFVLDQHPQYTTLCDKVCQWLATGLWFSPGTLVSSTTKTDCNDITEILLKVSLSTIPLAQWQCRTLSCRCMTSFHIKENMQIWFWPLLNGLRRVADFLNHIENQCLTLGNFRYQSVLWNFTYRHILCLPISSYSFKLEQISNPQVNIDNSSEAIFLQDIKLYTLISEVSQSQTLMCLADWFLLSGLWRIEN